MAQNAALARSIVAEAVGTAVLLAAVVGSGIMGERLAQGNDAVALLANTAATVAALYVLIAALASVSGAHFNPVVTLAAAAEGALDRTTAAAFAAAQFLAAIAGVALAHAMFELPLLAASSKVRSGAAPLLGEFVATAGLLATIGLVGRARPQAVPACVAAWIGAAYWFTSSTSFANPAVTLARALTDSFSGIRPADAPGFVLAQLCGAAAGVALVRYLRADGQQRPP